MTTENQDLRCKVAGFKFLQHVITWADGTKPS